MTALKLGTRRSALALAQARSVAEAIMSTTGRRAELVEVTTHGDVSTEPLARIGGTGVFVSALRDALLGYRIDLAVHSLKDLPTAPEDDLTVAAIPPREDARDVLCARDGLTLAELPVGARVGTGAPRRAAQLRALGLGLDVVPVRGNVDSRLARVADGTFDAVVVARAGLARLGRLDNATEVLDPLQMLPAPGQGALAVECRADDDVLDVLRALDDPKTRSAVTEERSSAPMTGRWNRRPFRDHQETSKRRQCRLRRSRPGRPGAADTACRRGSRRRRRRHHRRAAPPRSARPRRRRRRGRRGRRRRGRLATDRCRPGKAGALGCQGWTRRRPTARRRPVCAPDRR